MIKDFGKFRPGGVYPEWNWPNFSPSEFACKHTGELVVDTEFLDKLQQFRLFCGFPFIITSGYRHPTHPVERNKSRPGSHTLGCAADIRYQNGIELYNIITNFARFGFTGIGIAKTYVHLDSATTTSLGGAHRPVAWTY